VSASPIPDRFRFACLLQLLFRSAQRLLGAFAPCDVADVALDDLGTVLRINITDKLYRNSATVSGFKGQIVVTDNSLGL
jgi:hypothetical protein